MKKRIFFFLPTLAVFFLFACKSKDAAPPKPTVVTLQAESRSFSKRHCVNDDQCADFIILYPLVKGNHAATAEAVNKAIQARTLASVDGNTNLAFEVALDSAGANFIEQFKNLHRDFPEQTMGQTIQMTNKVLLNGAKVMTVQLDFDSYTGGAHPNTAVAVMSFDVQNGGRELKAADLLTDPNAVLPLLEKAYKKAKQLDEADDIGQLLITEDKKLPLPVNVGVVPEGILFAYSDYEVSPHAVGPADILLTWAELGSLADKSKWIGE